MQLIVSLQSLEMSYISFVFKGIVSKLLNMEHEEFHGLAPDDLAGLLSPRAPLCTILYTLRSTQHSTNHGAFSPLFASAVYFDIPHLLLLLLL